MPPWAPLTPATAWASARPRVGLLNVGTEEHKGRAELQEAHGLMAACAEAGELRLRRLVEGTDILSDRVDVIVTDGFTGNVALKTGEGTAKLVGDFLRQALTSTFWPSWARFWPGALKRLQRRIDPRRVNGGVFLGLNGTVVKSHGSADATGVAAAIGLAAQLAGPGLTERSRRGLHPRRRGAGCRKGAGGTAGKGRSFRMTIRAVVRGVGHYLPDRSFPTAEFEVAGRHLG
jgi:glycerol-3-phosphate acyltransferase PlsX